MPFEKGISGNPRGKAPKSREQKEFEAKCREWAKENSLARLVKWADADNPVASLAAVKEINERGFGKSEAISYLEANVTSETGFSAEELSRELESIVGATAGSTCGGNNEISVDPGK